MRFILALLLSLTLLGCASPKHQPEPLVEVREVKVLVETKCKVQPVLKPTLLLDSVKPGISVDKLLLAYARDEVSLRQYAEDLKVALINCVSNPEMVQ